MRRLLALALVLAAPAMAPAAPVTWEFYGITQTTTLPDIPFGSAISVFWTFDSQEPNVCSSGTRGLYYNQQVRVEVAGLTFGAGGVFLAGSRVNEGCFGGAPRPDRELRLFSWTGPNLSNATLVRNHLPQVSPGMFWMDAPSPLFPSAPPLAALWTGPTFIFPDGTGATVSTTLRPAPEPATVLLVLGGAALMWARRRRIE